MPQFQQDGPMTIELGVRDFIALTNRSGGLSADFSPAARAAAGTAAHNTVMSRRPEGYEKEVAIRHEFEWHNFRLVVRGRIDGLFENESGVLTIEEIKSTYSPLESLAAGQNPFHLAQLRLYHHFLGCRRPGEKIGACLTYVNLTSLEERTFDMDWSREESRSFFEERAVSYLLREEQRYKWLLTRDGSLTGLPFPFGDPRPGQLELMKAVEGAILSQRDILAEAATGIGKTIGVLYPAILNLASPGADKSYARIFYLTAKSAGAEIAKRTIGAMREKGMRLRVLYLLAKERICPLAGSGKPECGEGFCPYADDFYAKVDRAMPNILEAEEITPELLLRAAEEEKICPFELALELSLSCDLIVCDYNYAFDPSVYLRRFFSPGLPANSLFLVDEAHNLVARGREMYSATLSEADIASVNTLFGGGNEGLSFCLTQLLRQFNMWYQTVMVEGTQALRLPEVPKDFLVWAEGVIDLVSELLLSTPRGEERKTLLDFYYSLSEFNRVSANLSDDYAIYVETEGSGSSLRLFCLNPGPALRQRIERSTSAVFFSATLRPLRYFKELLGARDGCASVGLPCPFPLENRLYIHVPDVSTKYNRRESTKVTVAQVVMDIARGRKGNYIAFFPSYAYLGTVWAEIMTTRPSDIAVFTQRPNMGQAQQAEFLAKVCGPAKDKSNLGLAVMGGLFAEGVDMPGEQLIGTVIVGPGLPGLSLEQELVKEYFDERNGGGFDYAYRIPGAIRVVQAAGRVFRTPDDKGVVALIDDRFLEPAYGELLPHDWGVGTPEFSRVDYLDCLRSFWEG